MLRGLSTVGKAAGLAGFAVLKSVAKAVRGKRPDDISQYFPTYTHPERDSDLPASTPHDRSTAVIRNPGLPVKPQQSTGADTSDASMDEVPRVLAAQSHAAPLQRYDVSAAALFLNQQRIAAAYKAVNEQWPMPAARDHIRASAPKAKKEMPFDPLPGNNVAGGALSGPLSSSEGQKSGLFVISGEGEMDMRDDAHKEPSSNAPTVYIEDMPIAREEEEEGARQGKGSWLRRHDGMLCNRQGEGIAPSFLAL
ncbi:hypothetical protein WJX82_010633 [Trebouxia sp. C0006]